MDVVPPAPAGRARAPRRGLDDGLYFSAAVRRLVVLVGARHRHVGGNVENLEL